MKNILGRERWVVNTTNIDQFVSDHNLQLLPTAFLFWCARDHELAARERDERGFHLVLRQSVFSAEKIVLLRRFM
jgi:hypothetical protein